MRDLLAPFVEPFIQVFLLTFGDVPTILGLIVVQAILLAGQLSVVAGGLLRIDLTVRDTAIDAALLVVDALLYFVNSRVPGVRRVRGILGNGVRKAAYFDAKTHSVSFWDGFHRLVEDKKIMARLIGAAAAWFLMDFAYYGNTVSSPLVLSSFGSDHTVLDKTLTQLGILVLFAAPGYAVAALAMDRLGRKTIQILGFSMMAVTFGLLAVIPGVEKLFYPFLIIYGLSFFFTEFGPNATTFVYPSEIFPVRVRTTGHGIAAAMGKIGGFVGVFTFPYFMSWHGLPAAEGAASIVSVLRVVVTAVLLPETKGKSLEELSDEPSTAVEKAIV